MTAHQESRHASMDRARELVASMRDLCAKFERLGEEHESLLGDGRYDAFVRSLAHRAEDIARLERASEGVDRLLEDPGSGLARDEIEWVRAQVASIGSTIARVLERDAAIQARVEHERDALAAQLSGVRSTRSAMRAYSGASRTPNPRLQDRRG